MCRCGVQGVWHKAARNIQHQQLKSRAQPAVTSRDEQPSLRHERTDGHCFLLVRAKQQVQSPPTRRPSKYTKAELDSISSVTAVRRLSSQAASCLVTHSQPHLRLLPFPKGCRLLWGVSRSRDCIPLADARSLPASSRSRLHIVMLAFCLRRLLATRGAAADAGCRIA
ncbi:hypothetical protein NDU88_006012 [Pleurodeles waltl]|uniref:Uncharacterized protein n=1 Tax=Pleurodeles waltl TaxID=8319 RepID=A0AAV7RNQ6_PLEWA|nr:hypothetical protein NDU88_006012 [Pleurodeles waltl]